VRTYLYYQPHRDAAPQCFPGTYSAGTTFRVLLDWSVDTRIGDVAAEVRDTGQVPLMGWER
jgi:hypothetical protein